MHYKLILDSAWPFLSLPRWCYSCILSLSIFRGVVVVITTKRHVVKVNVIVVEFQEILRIIIADVVVEIERRSLTADHGESGEGHASGGQTIIDHCYCWRLRLVRLAYLTRLKLTADFLAGGLIRLLDQDCMMVEHCLLSVSLPTITSSIIWP